MKWACLLLAASVGASTALGATEARACGGCMHEPPNLQQMQSTVVTGHRMVVSISKQQTTLWDQVAYDGNPNSFAWILPMKGMVDVGLSSDLMFEELDARTQVTAESPVLPP